MGGAIALRYCLSHQNKLKGAIISAPGLIIKAKIPEWKKKMVFLLSKKFPGLTMGNGLNVEHLSRDSEVVEAYKKDPLVHDRVTARWG